MKWMTMNQAHSSVYVIVCARISKVFVIKFIHGCAKTTIFATVFR